MSETKEVIDKLKRMPPRTAAEALERMFSALADKIDAQETEISRLQALCSTHEALCDQQADRARRAEDELTRLREENATLTRERDEARERNLKASKWLCRYELAMLADDLDMKIQWDEEGPCSLAEDISPGFDPVAYQLEFEAERRSRQSKEGGE